MNESKRKLTKEIPGWFSIEKYAQAKNLSAYGWWLHLARRMAEFDNFHRGEACNVARFSETPMLSAEQIEQTWHRTALLRPWANPSARLSSYELSDTPTIKSLPLVWIAAGDYISEGTKDEKVGNAAARFNATIETDEDRDLLFMPYDLYLRGRGISNDGLLLVEVDSLATDEQILDDFKKWLSTARKEFGAVKSRAFTHDDFQEWSDFGVLPYIDLMLWSVANNVRLAQHAIGRALFPDDDETCTDPTERVRRTVNKKAEWLMDWGVLRALETQAIAERKSGMK